MLCACPAYAPPCFRLMVPIEAEPTPNTSKDCSSPARHESLSSTSVHSTGLGADAVITTCTYVVHGPTPRLQGPHRRLVRLTAAFLLSFRSWGAWGAALQTTARQRPSSLGAEEGEWSARLLPRHSAKGRRLEQLRLLRLVCYGQPAPALCTSPPNLAGVGNSIRDPTAPYSTRLDNLPERRGAPDHQHPPVLPAPFYSWLGARVVFSRDRARSNKMQAKAAASAPHSILGYLVEKRPDIPSSPG